MSESLDTPLPGFAEVIVDVQVRAVDRPFHYHIPPSLSASIRLGHRVLVPFGPRRVEGYITAFADTSPVADPKPILSLLDAEPMLSVDALELARWMTSRYLCLFSEALQCFLPPGGRLRSSNPAREQRVVQYRLACTPTQALDQAATVERRAPAQAALLRYAAGRSESSMSAAGWSQTVGCSVAAIRSLATKGLFAPCEVTVDRDPLAARPTKHALGSQQPLRPSAAQAAAIAHLRSALEQRTFHPALLYGVTGSGKTEVYLQAIQTVLNHGRQAIVLVPEIALTAQTICHFTSRFGNRVAVLHSRLSAGERFDTWQKVRQGRLPIVIGARSAIFAPAPDLGLVILDEEHEPSYKQDESPRYHAREVALERGRICGAVVLLGSATPSIESYGRSLHGESHLITMPDRIEQKPLPPIEVVDMRQEMKSGNRSIFSRRLHTELEKTLEAGEQAILFLNRRGYAQFVLCRECGLVVDCAHCKVSLTYHQNDRSLRCHYCGSHRPMPAACPQCRSPYLRPFGAGTQKVEEALAEAFPSATSIRMDADTTSRKHAHEEIVAAFAAGKAQVLIGTQMIAKGLHFPSVTLVGVIAADAGLHLPDFRSGERTFQLLTQVAGRAGRGKADGRVIVQTYSPEHYSIQAAARHDYGNFFRHELTYRRDSGYPPFSTLVRLIVSGEDERNTRKGAQEIARLLSEGLRGEGKRIAHSMDLKSAAGIPQEGLTQLVGPAPAPIAKVKDRHRWHVMLRATSAHEQVVSKAAQTFTATVGRVGLSLAIDVDPVSLL